MYRFDSIFVPNTFNLIKITIFLIKPFLKIYIIFHVFLNIYIIQPTGTLANTSVPIYLSILKIYIIFNIIFITEEK